jgi:hypothetical protein
VPIAGEAAAPANDRISITNTRLTKSAVDVTIKATGKGRAHIFLWSGDHTYIPVWTSSCASDPGEQGFTPCSASDGVATPWGTNMSGFLIKDSVVQVAAGTQHVSIPIDSAGYQALKKQGSALISFQTAANEVQAFDKNLH